MRWTVIPTHNFVDKIEDHIGSSNDTTNEVFTPEKS